MDKFFLFCLLVCFAEASASDSIMVCDYYSMLEARPDVPELYSDEMAADPIGCGITRIEIETSCDYKMVAGREDQPMKGLAPWQQEYYEHWVAQGRPQVKEKGLASPLMMFGEHEKGEQEEVKQQLQQAVRNREMADSSRSGSHSSGSQQRDVGMPRIRETTEDRQLPLEIKFGNNLEADEVSTITEGTTKEGNSFRSPAVDLGLNTAQERCLQAQKALKEAKEKSKAAAEYLDNTRKQWEISINLEREKQQYNILQRKAFLAFAFWESSKAAFEKADADLRAIFQNFSPFVIEATAHAEAMNNAFQTHQALFVQEQTALARCVVMQQRATALGVVEGVNYGNLLTTAQQRVNEAHENLQKCRADWNRIKFENYKTSFQQNPPAVGRGHESLSSPKQSEESALSRSKTIYQDQGTQISKEDLEVWEREALLKKQARWKPIFHRMVEAMSQAKEAAIAEVSKKSAEEILFEESEKEIQEIAEQTLQEEKAKQRLDGMVKQPAEENRAHADRYTARRGEASDFLHQVRIEAVMSSTIEEEVLMHVLSPEWVREIVQPARKEHFFAELFPPGTEAIEREKWELEEASIHSRRQAKEVYRAEMGKFCTERVGLLHRPKEEEPTQPAPSWMEAIMTVAKNTRNFLTQSCCSSYGWGD